MNHPSFNVQLQIRRSTLSLLKNEKSEIANFFLILRDFELDFKGRYIFSPIQKIIKFSSNRRAVKLIFPHIIGGPGISFSHLGKLFGNIYIKSS